MKIERIVIQNFRSLSDVKIDLNPMTAFVGRNGAGKSTVLHALQFFYDVNYKLEPEDFFAKDVTDPLTVTVTFIDLLEVETEEFASYTADGKLTVKKVAKWIDGGAEQKYYGTRLAIRKFSPIRKEQNKTERRKLWNEIVKSGTLPDLTTPVARADDIDPLMHSYEEAHPELLEPIELEKQFFGPRSIGGGKLDNHTSFVIVPAVREAEDELAAKKGVIAQLIDMIVRRKVEARDDVRALREEFDTRLRSVFSSENLTELPALATEISTTLDVFAPGAILNLDWQDPELPALVLPSTIASVTEDGFTSHIRRKGHGLQRALVMSLLQYLSTVATEVDETDTESPNQSADLILAIEEPELYQHPLRSRYLVDVLRTLTAAPEPGVGGRNQVLFTSHSPYFVTMSGFDDIRIVQKAAGGKFGSVKPSIVRSYNLSQAVAAVSSYDGATNKNYTSTGFVARSSPVMNTIVNEGFFADRVLVVEGYTEYALFWALQDVLGLGWQQKGIAVVPAFGKNNIDRPTTIFRGFGIPTYFVFDGDASQKDKPHANATAARNRRYLTMAGAPPEDFPETQVNSTWAVLSDKTETTIKAELGSDRFMAIRMAVAEELGYDEEAQVLKNLDGMTEFLRAAYQQDLEIPTFEDIADRMSKLDGVPHVVVAGDA